MQSTIPASKFPAALALFALAALGTAACGGPSAPPEQAAAPAPQAAAPAEDTQAAEAAAAEQAAAEQAAADLAAREQELKAREIELQLRERELAAQKEAAAKAAAKPATPPKTASAPKQAAAAPAPAAAAPPPPPVTVPVGTQVSVKLNSAYSTKTTALGEVVNAELASDLVVDGRRVAKAGAPISGTVIEVVSGSRKIGAVPTIKVDFTQLVVADGSTQPVEMRINVKGQSEKGRDTAKIAGGAAAGAIIGHQVDDDKGKVIGGILGGAAGAIGAQKTGTELEIPAGSVHVTHVRTAFTYSGK